MQFSIVIPARNEEKFLPSCLDSIKISCALANVTYEIIVVLNRCTDRTEEIALEYGCRVVVDDTKNLSHIRNSGAKVALGDIIVTVDADSRVSKNMFKTILSKMNSGKFIAGGVMIIPERISLGILCSAICMAPVALRYGIQCGVFFVSKNDYFKIGGFNEDLYSAEDVDFARRLKELGRQQGKKYCMWSLAYIITSCRKFDKLGDWYFLKNYKESLALLRSSDRKAADKIWYDFER